MLWFVHSDMRHTLRVENEVLKIDYSVLYQEIFLVRS